jgi:N-acetylneuraminate lyase
MTPYPPLTGLIAAPYTAFQPDGSLNLALIEKQAASLISNGVAGAFVCGTTGEGVSLTISERMQLAQRWQEVAGADLRVIVHVGHNCLADSRALAGHAQKIGAAGFGCFSPFFFKPANAGDLAAFCADVAAAAPELPFYYYQIPSMTGVNITAADFLRAAAPRISNLAGVKFTHENLMDFAECVGLEDGRYDIVFGRDEILLAGLSLGARGAAFNKLLAAFASNDVADAREKQAEINEVISILGRYGGLIAGKAMMKMIGLDCGPVRLPLRSPSEQRQAKLQSELERVYFFDLCSKV